MTYAPTKRHRRSIRLKGYDYTQQGAYFVTVCTRDRACLFSEVVDGEMRLNAFGEMVRECWLAIPDHVPHAALDEFVIMPNHVHGIICIVNGFNVGARHALQREQFGKPVPGSIPTIVRSFKSATTRRINEHQGTPGLPVWQRNYYEHIIRSDETLARIRQYIAENPLRWAFDRDNPQAVTPEPENP